MELKYKFDISVPAGTNIVDGLKQLEAEYIHFVHQQTRYNQSKTAIALGISRGTIRTKLKEHFGDRFVGERE